VKAPPDVKKVTKKAALIGVALAVLCHFLPPDYRVICQALSKFCTGGL
jgi:hypothetical protein